MGCVGVRGCKCGRVRECGCRYVCSAWVWSTWWECVHSTRVRVPEGTLQAWHEPRHEQCQARCVGMVPCPVLINDQSQNQG